MPRSRRRWRGKAPRVRLSATVISANSSRRSGTRHSPCATRASTSVCVMDTPSYRTSPRAGNSPITALSRVVLPAPFGPITVTIEPAGTFRLA